MPPTTNDPRPDYVYGPAQGDQSGVTTGLTASREGSQGPSVLEIVNNGGLIASSNYWDTAFSQTGGMFLSFNARTARLLVPAAHVAALKTELRGARRVQLDMGPCPIGDPRFPPWAYRLIFDDRSDCPFFILVGPGQFDRVVPGREHGTEVRVDLYGPGPRRIATFPATFRRVAVLPEIYGGAL
jgi:hypothetical protein